MNNKTNTIENYAFHYIFSPLYFQYIGKQFICLLVKIYPLKYFIIRGIFYMNLFTAYYGRKDKLLCSYGPSGK